MNLYIYIWCTRVLNIVKYITTFHILQILLYPGFIEKTGFADPASLKAGGPVGELVQWSDLICGLYLSGHDITISATSSEATGR